MNTEQEYWVLGHKICPLDVSGDYDMVMGETPPNTPGPPSHYHNGFNELFLVLEGEMEFVVNGELNTIKKGEAVDLPPRTVHTFINKADGSCRWINVHSPKGFLQFFKEMGIPAEEANAMKKSVDESIIKKVMEKAIEHDMHIQMTEDT